MYPNSNDKCPGKRHTEKMTQRDDTERRRPREDRGRDGSDTATSPEMPAATRYWKRQETDPPLERPEEAGPCRHLDS